MTYMLMLISPKPCLGFHHIACMWDRAREWGYDSLQNPNVSNKVLAKLNSTLKITKRTTTAKRTTTIKLKTSIGLSLGLSSHEQLCCKWLGIGLGMRKYPCHTLITQRFSYDCSMSIPHIVEVLFVVSLRVFWLLWQPDNHHHGNRVFFPPV